MYANVKTKFNAFIDKLGLDYCSITKNTVLHNNMCIFIFTFKWTYSYQALHDSRFKIMFIYLVPDFDAPFNPPAVLN